MLASDTLAYQVAAGVAVTSRSGTDGVMEAYWGGGPSPAVEANQSTNPRIDCVWLQAHNQKELRDTDNLVVIGVTQGTPAASPVKPTPPAGVTVLSYMQVPANSTSLRNATRVGEIDYAVPYGAAQGLIASGAAQVRHDPDQRTERMVPGAGETCPRTVTSNAWSRSARTRPAATVRAI